MTVEEKVQAILEAAGTVTALCPAARIRVPGTWQNLSAPYIIHFPVAVEPTRDHSGLKVLRIWDPYQVSIFASTYSAGRALADAIRDALDGVTDDVQIFWQGLRYQQNREVELEQFIVEFRIAEGLN